MSPEAFHEILTKATQPCGCDGTGKIQYHSSDGIERDLGDGLVGGPMQTWGSNLCQCRRELPERDGQARWWESKVIYSASWESVVFEPSAEISVRGEVPVSDDNYVLRRTSENFYWPSSVSVVFTDPELNWLFPDEARELARLLIEAADAADAYDDVPEVES